MKLDGHRTGVGMASNDSLERWPGAARGVGPRTNDRAETLDELKMAPVGSVWRAAT